MPEVFLFLPNRCFRGVGWRSASAAQLHRVLGVVMVCRWLWCRGCRLLVSSDLPSGEVRCFVCGSVLGGSSVLRVVRSRLALDSVRRRVGAWGRR